ncbi:MAG: HAMP domain-containing histidine kinase [Deltaproteobacteria bacterium]|nr:HAMP domain-containing histidine kinase [Deltaproteobacteria bacterium]
MGALALVRRADLSADRRVNVVVLAVVGITLLTGLYCVAVQGELEMLGLALVFLTLGCMVAFPWGIRGQLSLAAAAVFTYVLAVVGGARYATPLSLHVVGLGLAIGFTVLGAYLAERSHLKLSRRDAELKRTNVELERASRLKSEFVSTMSHELRTPLNVIIGYLDLLGDGAFGALATEQLDPVGRAARSARELFELITATLDLSRIDAGIFSLRLNPVSVPELVGELAVEARDLPLRPRVTIAWETESSLRPLETDRRMLKLVLRNLLGNALKFTEEGSVTIRAREVDEGVELAVIDTGMGVPADATEKIFEPFQQLEAPAGTPSGVGLGLHIVRRLVGLLGGRIRVESEVGRGSTFRVWLPYARQPTERPVYTPDSTRAAAP